MKVKFSIIIPSLNNKIFLSKCLKSIFSQKYKNYEVLVMDGGSTDGTINLLKKYRKKIKYFIKKDRGQFDAINKGIKLSKGEWVTWQNCDDFYYNKNVLEIFNKKINEHPSKDLFIANIYLVKKNGKIIRDIKYVTPSFLSLLYEDMTLTNQACFWRKSLNKKIGYMRNMKINFDYEWFLRVLKYNNDCDLNINKELACFRIHKDQKTQKQDTKDQLKKYQIKLKFGYKKFFLIPIITFLTIRRFFLHLLQGNIYYILRGVFKFFFIKRNKEYINS